MQATNTEGVLPSSRNTPQSPPLPSELLSQIFRYYLQLSTPYNPEPAQRLRQSCLAEHLLLVCKSWHDAATADGSLWREIILDPEIALVTPYKSLHSYTKVRSIRSRTQLLHISINNDPDLIKRLGYLKAYYYLVTTMSRWERLLYYLKYYDIAACITIQHLAASTPNLREVVIRSPIRALKGLSEILPETPNLKFLEIDMPSIGPLPLSLCTSVTIASIRIAELPNWLNTITQFKSIHTLILKPVHSVHSDDTWTMLNLPLDLPSVQTLILVGGTNSLQSRLGSIKLLALQTLEVDLSPSGLEKRWSRTMAGGRDQLTRLLNAGLRELVLNSVWFDRCEDAFDMLQDANGSVGKLVCIDVTCTLQSGKGQKLEIDLGATLMQHGAVSPSSALSVLDGLLKKKESSCLN